MSGRAEGAFILFFDVASIWVSQLLTCAYKYVLKPFQVKKITKSFKGSEASPPGLRPTASPAPGPRYVEALESDGSEGRSRVWLRVDLCAAPWAAEQPESFYGEDLGALVFWGAALCGTFLGAQARYLDLHSRGFDAKEKVQSTVQDSGLPNDVIPCISS